MIFRRSIVAELTSTASAVFTVLFSILFSVGLVRILGQAAGGRVDNQAVLQLVALTALTWLPVILTLTLFVAVLMTLSRAYRDSEMVVWFAAGQSLLAWVGPVLRFAWPIVIAIGLLAFFVTPWSQAQIEDARTRFAQRDDVSRVAPGRFIESGGAERVFFVESVDFDGGEVRNVFVSAQEPRARDPGRGGERDHRGRAQRRPLHRAEEGPALRGHARPARVPDPGVRQLFDPDREPGPTVPSGSGARRRCRPSSWSRSRRRPTWARSSGASAPR